MSADLKIGPARSIRSKNRRTTVRPKAASPQDSFSALADGRPLPGKDDHRPSLSHGGGLHPFSGAIAKYGRVGSKMRGQSKN
jgi:hypothetical protein